jgi:3-dehydroquinate dehydratase
MKRRERWHKVLDREVARWSSKSCGELRAELKEGNEYEVEFESVTHQIEVEILENTAAYVHISIAVDDGSLPCSIFPATHSFIRKAD